MPIVGTDDNFLLDNAVSWLDTLSKENHQHFHNHASQSASRQEPVYKATKFHGNSDIIYEDMLNFSSICIK